MPLRHLFTAIGEFGSLDVNDRFSRPKLDAFTDGQAVGRPF